MDQNPINPLGNLRTVGASALSGLHSPCGRCHYFGLSWPPRDIEGSESDSRVLSRLCRLRPRPLESGSRVLSRLRRIKAVVAHWAMMLISVASSGLRSALRTPGVACHSSGSDRQYRPTHPLPLSRRTVLIALDLVPHQLVEHSLVRFLATSGAVWNNDRIGKYWVSEKCVVARRVSRLSASTHAPPNALRRKASASTATSCQSAKSGVD